MKRYEPSGFGVAGPRRGPDLRVDQRPMISDRLIQFQLTSKDRISISAALYSGRDRPHNPVPSEFYTRIESLVSYFYLLKLKRKRHVRANEVRAHVRTIEIAIQNTTSTILDLDDVNLRRFARGLGRKDVRATNALLKLKTGDEMFGAILMTLAEALTYVTERAKDEPKKYSSTEHKFQLVAALAFLLHEFFKIDFQDSKPKPRKGVDRAPRAVVEAVFAAAKVKSGPDELSKLMRRARETFYKKHEVDEDTAESEDGGRISWSPKYLRRNSPG